MARPYQSESEKALLAKIIPLMKSLDLVFFLDWDHTENSILFSVETEGRVVNPLNPNEPVGSWSNQEKLAKDYMKLRSFLISEGLLSVDENGHLIHHEDLDES